MEHGIDRIAEQLVGLTLLILGVYVLGSLFEGNPAPRSRFHVMAGALRWVHWKMKGYWHDHAGLLVMNTVMMASAVGLFGFSSRLPRFQFVVTALTAIYSLAVAAFFLFGSSGLLPLWDEAAGGPFPCGNACPRVTNLVLSVLLVSTSRHHSRVMRVQCNSPFRQQ